MSFASPMPGLADHSISQLLKALTGSSDQSEFGAILSNYSHWVQSQQLTIDRAPDLTPFLRWDTKHYTRTCITRNPRFELLVICYLPGQSTSIHDYDSEKAWVVPLFGDLALERFSLNRENTLVHSGTEELRSGAMASLSGEDSIHRFYNPGPHRAASLNLYAKPMSRWRVYDEASGAASFNTAGSPP